MSIFLLIFCSYVQVKIKVFELKKNNKMKKIKYNFLLVCFFNNLDINVYFNN